MKGGMLYVLEVKYFDNRINIMHKVTSTVIELTGSSGIPTP